MPRVPPPKTLSRRFELASTAVTIAGRTYDLLRPKNIDDLISEEDFNLDERIPYWADCWPSSRVLAERLLREQGQGRQLLELGCGIGLVTLAAAQVGFDVLATDYYADALEFTSANASRHALGQVDTRLVDWRKLPSDLGHFDVVAASDVLYERQQPALVAGVLARTLSAGGIGLLTDPGRRFAESFIEECARQDLKAELTGSVPAEDAKAQLTVSIFEIRRG
jgi:ETFB lysine methyltransferase